jgi:ankyrin repeat protein
MEKLLFENHRVHVNDHRKWTPLHYAMYNGHAKLVNKLVKFEADTGILKEMETS